MPGTPDKVLSRDFTIDVSALGTPSWVPIGGLDEDGISQAVSSRTIDYMDADDNGVAKPVRIGLGYTYSLKGARMESVVDGTRDPGQAAVEATQDITGLAGMLMYQITSPAAATPEVLTFSATAEVNAMAGGDKCGWTATLQCFGSPVRS
ncbi:MAG TPA: hypothetical protein VFC59_00255 [Cryobacterium sp.]|nr:hypothetical protein [Cryobacterium sp.]